MAQYWPILNGNSANRCWLHDQVDAISPTHPVLDIGGSHDYEYHAHLDTDRDRTTTFNLPGAGADVAGDATEGLPFDEESFETILCFNVLEHIYDYETVIEEIYRVLRPGGTVYVSVPFLYRIHGAPNDYTRYTPAHLQEAFCEFESVDVRTLDPGPFSAAASMLAPAMRLNTLRFLSWIISGKLDQFAHWVNDALKGKTPIAVFVEASK